MTSLILDNSQQKLSHQPLFAVHKINIYLMNGSFQHDISARDQHIIITLSNIIITSRIATVQILQDLFAAEVGVSFNMAATRQV